MTLSVNPYCRDAMGELQWLDVPSEYNDLAGVEHTRWSFWSSAAIQELGLTLVTTLAYTDIYAEDEALAQLTQEIEILTDYVAALSNEERTYWAFRLLNVKAAIRVAEARKGGVYIG